MTRTSLATPEDMRPLHEVTARWARRPVVEECVCGGEVRSESGLDVDIIAAVRRHQIDPVHIVWDQSHGTPLAAWQMEAIAVARV